MFPLIGILGVFGVELVDLVEETEVKLVMLSCLKSSLGNDLWLVLIPGMLTLASIKLPSIRWANLANVGDEYEFLFNVPNWLLDVTAFLAVA